MELPFSGLVLITCDEFKISDKPRALGFRQRLEEKALLFQGTLNDPKKDCLALRRDAHLRRTGIVAIGCL
jgi:hypothetical protein